MKFTLENVTAEELFRLFYVANTDEFMGIILQLKTQLGYNSPEMTWEMGDDDWEGDDGLYFTDRQNAFMSARFIQDFMDINTTNEYLMSGQAVKLPNESAAKIAKVLMDRIGLECTQNVDYTTE